MDGHFSAFALRQILMSTAVIGPILILIGFCYYIFKQDRKAVFIYLVIGMLCTAFGVSMLYYEFSPKNVEIEIAVE